VALSASAAEAADLPAGSQVVVARQPIVDLNCEVVGFELLYRPRDPDLPAASGEEMTAQVVLGALTIGIDQLVGDKTMFCNAERGVLTGETPITLPPHRTVIEILETVHIDDEAVAGCRALVEAGFRIALDDFEWSPGAERLLEMASIVKIDFLAVPREELPSLVERCRAFDVLLLAEKVETDEDIALARELGFELFQGYAVQRPVIVRGQTIAASALAHVQLAMTMLAEDLDFEQVEEILRREPGLVVQVLQMAAVGSQHGLRRQVRTVREALVLLGTTKIRQWVALTILSSQPGQTTDGVATALVRARMAELLTRRRGGGVPEVAFTAGLLSALDLLLGIDLADLEDTLDIDEELKDGAFRRAGALGALVGEVADYQDALADGSGRVGACAELDAVAAAAFAWAMPYVSGLGGPA
jgi:EAL and modified HD-GYP domain-containing signal transduction protein